MKLIQIPKRYQEILTALGRAGCPEICLTIMSPKDREVKRSSEVYYSVASQLRMPWATYSKLTKYLTEKGFIEFNRATYNNRNVYFVKLTALGRDLVKMYIGGVGKTPEDLESEQPDSSTAS